ncbi:MAG TPA: O-antigen ligase family protein [Burkholderiales bacterium]|nr:O-antigen ligase family protein [Burkholderiales bacterium]
MSFQSANILGATTDSPAPAAAVQITAVLAGMAVFAGIAAAVIGNWAGYRAIYYVALLVLFVIGGLVTLTRKDPLSFAFLALIVCFPIASAQIPPGRLNLTVFHAAMAALTIGLIGKKLSGSSTVFESLFPTRSLWLATLFIIPCVAFSQYPLWSLQVFTSENFLVYIFLLFALDQLKRERGFERLVLLLSIGLLVMGIGLFIDHFLHMNLSLRGSNLNQSTLSESGTRIYRAGGFFQDPQKAGTYLACMVTFLLLLSIRGRFRGMKMRYLVWAAIAFSLGAVVTTISRSAILACLSVSALTLFLFNKWNAVAKLIIAGGAVVVAVSVALTPVETWLNILPTTVAKRFVNLHEDFEIRRKIWLDTWDMFSGHPLTGIGVGSFRPYLIETQPTVLDHYGLGALAGVVYIPDQPESGYLKIFYEGGILGSIAALLVAGDALRRAITLIVSKNATADARTEAIAALAGILTFATTFVTLYTLSDPRIAALFSFFLAVILHRSLQLTQTAQKA